MKNLLSGIQFYPFKQIFHKGFHIVGFFMCDMDIFVLFLSNNNFVFNRFQITYKRSKRGLYIM